MCRWLMVIGSFERAFVTISITRERLFIHRYTGL
jgi:hypothetical protein